MSELSAFCDRARRRLEKTNPEDEREIQRFCHAMFVDGIRLRQRLVAHSLVKDHGGQVLRGPFQGLKMTMIDKSWHGVTPQLLGAYEAELHAALEAAIARRPPVVINIGCADGYYAVGLARRLPQARVIAVDISPEGLEATRKTAADNGVADQVETSGPLAPERLNALLAEGGLVVVDCEGCETSVLSLAAAPNLARADIIVEMHDYLVAGTSNTLTERFNATHQMERIAYRIPDPFLYPETRLLPPIDRFLVLNDGRPWMEWGVFTSNAHLAPPN